LNRETVIAIGNLYLTLSIFILLGLVDFSSIVYLFLSLSAAFYTFGHIMYSIKEEAITQISNNTLKKTRRYSILIFIGNNIIGSTLSSSLFFTIMIKLLLPSYVSQVSNAATLLSLALVFFTISIFEKK
jgi:hypothetical protein